MKKIIFIASIVLASAFIMSSCNNDKSTSSVKKEQLAADEAYTCKMHNEVISDHPGKCPKCGMSLVKQKMTDEQKRLKESGKSVKPKD
jgi:hypothetical protein